LPVDHHRTHLFLSRTWRHQGARLTAFEIVCDELPGTLICDSMASALMNVTEGGIHACVVGADRVVVNGDTANKIGTYQLAIAAKVSFR